MKLENQVTSLKISKRLKELGVEQESVHYWSKPCKEGVHIITQPLMPNDYVDVSAFTVAELGELLPGRIGTKNGAVELVISKRGVNNYVEYTTEYGACSIEVDGTNDESEANARGKMLIYLLEQKLI